jgi:hydroxymethylbilane synthase
MKIKVGARSSPLSRMQVQEVLQELKQHHPSIEFDPLLIISQGDKDLKTSLRTLDKTDFFTKEVDEMVLTGKCRVGIHSAKDLPEPLPEGLAMAALTKGIDPRDVLVMRLGATLENLQPGSIIATSSPRREENVRLLRPDLSFIDLRGTVETRLAKLETHEADGIVVAEAALIRLGLTHLNRIYLPNETAPLQGKLAILVRSDDEEMLKLFSSLDSRKKTILYLGLNSPNLPQANLIHYPLIQIEPRPFNTSAIQTAFSLLPQFTHLIFTSQNAVVLFFKYLEKRGICRETIQHQTFIAVGRATAKKIKQYHPIAVITAKEETAEGIIKELETVNLTNAYIFWPHSSLSRPTLSRYFQKQNIRFLDCIFYDTKTQLNNVSIDIKTVDEIVFSSPSCVDAFIEIFGELPFSKTLTSLGPITAAYLSQCSR